MHHNSALIPWTKIKMAARAPVPPSLQKPQYPKYDRAISTAYTQPPRQEQLATIHHDGRQFQFQITHHNNKSTPGVCPLIAILSHLHQQDYQGSFSGSHCS